MSGGTFSIDLGLAEQVSKLLTSVDAEVNQYRAQLFTAVANLENSWQSPNKASFYNDWGTYCNAVIAIGDIGPKLVSGLTHEIQLVQQAEQVQF